MRLGAVVLALLSSACAAPKPIAPAQPVVSEHLAVGVPTAAPTVPVTPPPPAPPRANFQLDVAEIVASPQDDIGSYVKVFVDNLPAGETRVAERSQDKSWSVALSTGNHLFRFQKWELPDTGDWAALDPQYQPPERFIRIEPGQKTIVRLKFYDDSLRNSLEIRRQPLPVR